MAQSNFRPKFKKDIGTRKHNPRQAWLKLYDSVWQSYRKKFLAINGRCYACGSRAEVVDHVRPHKGDITLFRQLDNHIPLCSRCHNTVTALFDRHGNSLEQAASKTNWLNLCRRKRSLTFKIKVMGNYE